MPAFLLLKVPYMYYTFYGRKGNNILIRYKNPGDPVTRSKTVDFYKPSLFTSDSSVSDWQNIYGENVKKIEFENVKEAKNYAEQYKDVDSMSISGNSNYENQFIVELFDGKEPDYEAANIRLGFIDIEVFSPDEFPKPEEAKHPINAVTVYDSVDKKFYVLGLEYKGCAGFSLDNLSEADREMMKGLPIEYFAFNTEEDLVRNLLQHIHDHAYDCISGWNSEGFDIPYIVNRAHKLLGENATKRLLSPFNMLNKREFINSFGQNQEAIDIVGMPHIDYMQLYKKHTYTPRESYNLGFIGQEELSERKLSYEEERNLAELYKSNYSKFIAYNIRDVDLMVRLEDKLGLFGLVYAMSYYSLSNYSEAMGTVKIWEQLIAKFLYTKNKVPPFRKQKITEERDFEGAYVKTPIKGFHDWVLSYDLNSLYPHIEQQWNIGPETHVPYKDLPTDIQSVVDDCKFDDLLNKKVDLDLLKQYDLTMTANFECYKTDKMSFFSEIKRELYSQRKVFKQQMLEAKQKMVDADNKKDKKFYSDLVAKLNNMQLGLKVLLNGGYGALGNKHFLYYKVENAEAITMSGQLVNKWTCIFMNDFFKKIFDTDLDSWVYSDTDSGYFTIAPFVKTLPEMDRSKLLDVINQFSKEVIEPQIIARCQELADYMNCYEQRMFWSREIISNKAVWVGKKKYVMSVYDDEGTRYLHEPYYKIMGMESVKSSTPKWARGYLIDCYKMCLTGTEEEMQKIVSSAVDEFYSFDINDIAMPKGVSQIDKYLDKDRMFIKGTPKNVKAAIAHNIMIKKLGLKKIESITGGSKIKFVELKMPNPTGIDVIGFDAYLPKEFEIEQYINKELILEKSFIQPLRIFLDVINWSDEEQVDMFSF